MRRIMWILDFDFADLIDRHLPVLSYGRDMRTANETAQTVPNCQVVLGDRKLTTTLKRCTIALIRSASVLYLMAWLSFLMFGRLLILLAGPFEETVGRQPFKEDLYSETSRIAPSTESCVILFRSENLSHANMRPCGIVWPQGTFRKSLMLILPF